jgi:hypothetical protein
MPRKMLSMRRPWIFNMEVQHDALQDRMIKIINISGTMHTGNSAWSQRKNSEYFWIFRSPWSYDSNKSRIKTIGGSYKRLCPNHRLQHVLKSVLDSTQCWSKTDIARLFELRFQWMTTRWIGNFIKFSIELYFDICSVLDRGEIYETETARRWWEQERGDGDDNIEEKGDQWLH